MGNSMKAKPWSAGSTRGWVPLLAGVCLVAVPCQALVLNGGFDTGLADWTSAGDVQAGPEAALADTQVTYSALYQGVSLASGDYVLEFDLLNLLSPDVPTDPFVFADTFFASLYFSDDLATFDLAGGVFDGVEAILDMDAAGPFNVNAVVSPSALGGDWLRVSFAFSNSHTYAIPTFELFDFNTIPGDSQVRVDNVQITARESGIVPEPTSLTLMGVGLAGLGVRRALNRRK